MMINDVRKVRLGLLAVCCLVQAVSAMDAFERSEKNWTMMSSSIAHKEVINSISSDISALLAEKELALAKERADKFRQIKISMEENRTKKRLEAEFNREFTQIKDKLMQARAKNAKLEKEIVRLKARLATK